MVEQVTMRSNAILALILRGLEFDRETGTGVILVNWGSILVGKLSILLAGSIEQQNELKALLKQRL